MRDGSFLAGVIKDGDIFINSIMSRFYIEALTHGITCTQCARMRCS